METPKWNKTRNFIKEMQKAELEITIKRIDDLAKQGRITPQERRLGKEWYKSKIKDIDRRFKR